MRRCFVEGCGNFSKGSFGQVQHCLRNCLVDDEVKSMNWNLERAAIMIAEIFARGVDEWMVSRGTSCGLFEGKKGENV